MLFLTMIFMHILDDFCLQAKTLSSLKQKSWWTEQKEYKPMYRYDYIVALVMHSFSWTFMIMFPIALKVNFSISAAFISAFVINATIHFIIDDLKANRRKINLVADQTVHILQVIVTALIFSNI